MDVDNLLLDSKVVPFFDEGEKAVCLMAATQVSFIGEHLSLSLLRTVVYQSPLNPNACFRGVWESADWSKTTTPFVKKESGEGEAMDDLFSAYMNLENIDALNSPEADMESSRASGTKTNGSDDTEGESSSVNYESELAYLPSINRSPLFLLQSSSKPCIYYTYKKVFRGVATWNVRAMKEVWNIVSVSTGIKNTLLLKDATTLVMVAMEAPVFTFQFLDIFPNALLLLEVVSAGK
ncbi:hypothetical protein YC2023_024517 [Brassica napus]